MASIRDILAGRAAVELYVRDKLRAGLEAAQARLQRFSVSVAAIGVSFQTVAAMASRAMSLVESTLTGPADQLQNLTDRTGLSVQILQALAEAGADSGATLESVQGAARALANFLQQVEKGGQGAAETLADLGLTAAQLQNATQDERFMVVADALAAIEDPARRAALAQDVFGRGAIDLLPVVMGGAKAIEAYKQRLQEVGALRTGEQVAAADELGDAIGRLQRRIADLGFSALSAIAPQLNKVIDAAVGLVQWFNRLVVENPRLSATLGILFAATIVAAGGIATFTGVVWAVTFAVEAATIATGAFTATMSILGMVVALALTPLGKIAVLAIAAVAALGLLGVTLLATTESGRAFVASMMAEFDRFAGFVRVVLGGILTAIATADFGLAASVALAGLSVAFETGWASAKITTANAVATIWAAVSRLGFGLAAMMAQAMAGLVRAVASGLDAVVQIANQALVAIGKEPIQFSSAQAAAGLDGLAKSLEGAGESLARGFEAGAAKIGSEAAADVAKAVMELNKLTQEANRKKAEWDALLKFDKPPPGDGVDGGDIGKEIRDSITRGTFSARLAGSIGNRAGEKLMGDVAANTREAAELLTDIRDRLRPGMLVVG